MYSILMGFDGRAYITDSESSALGLKFKLAEDSIKNTWLENAYYYQYTYSTDRTSPKKAKVMYVTQTNKDTIYNYASNVGNYLNETLLTETRTIFG